jgi:hypothetical protein
MELSALQKPQTSGKGVLKWLRGRKYQFFRYALCSLPL